MKVIWISAAKKTIFLLLISTTLIGLTSAFYYQDQNSGITEANSGFSLPKYDSSAEILTLLAAPFLVISMLLRWAITQALHFTIRDRDEYPQNFLGPNDEPDVSTEATIISVAITAMLVPTSLWQFQIVMQRAIGTIPVLIILGVMLMIGYRVFT